MVSVFVADQATKLWIVHELPFGTGAWHFAESYQIGWRHGGLEVIPGFFYITHVGNTGAAWSMFSGRSGWLALLAAATLLAIYFWRRSLGLQERFVQVGFGLLCGGILGNLVDRLQYGHVIDFLDFHFGTYVYPTFNVADSGICIGVGLYLIHSLRHPSETS